MARPRLPVRWSFRRTRRPEKGPMMRSRRTRNALLLVPAAAALMLVSACGATAIDTAASRDGADGAGSGPTTLQQSPEFGKEPHQMLSATESRQVGWFVADAGG